MNLSKNDISTLVFQFSEYLENQIRIDNANPSVLDFNPAEGSTSATQLENCTGIGLTPLTNIEDNKTMAIKRLRVCIGYNDDGTPIVKHISGKTEFELAEKAAKALWNSERRAEVFGSESAEIVNKPTIPTFGEYVTKWLYTFKSGKLRPKTLKGYQSIIKVHFLPTWSGTPLDQIDVTDVQQFLNDRSEHSQKSLQEMRTLLKQILNAAVADKLIDTNPAADKRIYNPATSKNERKVLTMEEWHDVIDQLDKLNGFDRLYMAIVAYTGLRRGEVLGLQWTDIDLTNRVIHVRRNVTHTCNEPIIGEPKTEKGKRQVPIMDGLMKYLTPVKEKGYIIARAKAPESPITFSTFDNMWTRIKTTIDLHDATSHVFRHTLATMLYHSGTDIKTIQQIVGHADFGTTMNTYVHAQDGKSQEAMQEINAKLDSIGA